MLLSDLDQLRCVLCRCSFLAPQNLPHLLPCTHYICSACLQGSSQPTVICPEDLETNSIKDIRSNCQARKAMQRLVKQHTAFNQNNQLFCIQSLSKHFQSVLDSRNQQQLDFKGLVQRIIQNQINRLKTIHQSILEELESPFKMVREWKEMVREYLSHLKTIDRASKKEEITNELNYFVEQGRRIKIDLHKFQKLDFNSISNIIAGNPAVCLRNQFALHKYIEINEKSKEPRVTGLGQCNFQDEEERNQSILIKSKQKSAKQSKISLKQKNKGLEGIKSSRQSLRSQENLVRNTEDINIRRDKMHSQYSIIISDKNSLNENQNLMKFSKNSLEPLRQTSKYDPNYQNQNLLSDTKLLLYSLSPSKHDQQLNEMNSDEILLTQKEERQQYTYVEKKADNEQYDFLQPWEITQSLSSQSIVVEKRMPFDWEKERNSYIRKLQHSKVEEAISETTYSQSCIQLINYSVCDMDLGLYLQQWPKQHLQVIKLVKTGLSDQQLNELLNFILNSKVTTLVLSGNCLGQISLDALLNYTKVTDNLRNVYLSKNQINPLKGQTRQKLSLLRERGINLYI